MKNLTKTFKLFYFFLVLCFILVSISSGGRKAKGYWMDVVISPIDSLCAVKEVPYAVLAVDTTDPDGCKGALIPFTSKSIYINTLEQCFTLIFFPGSDIFIQKVEISLERDRNTGEILGGRFWLKDTNQKYYKTEVFELVFPVPTYPSGSSFSIPVDQCLKVYPQTGRGKKKPLGYLTVGMIEFLPPK